MERDQTLLLNPQKGVRSIFPRKKGSDPFLSLVALVLMFMADAGFDPALAAPAIQPISTAVIKSTTGLCLRGKICHVD